MTGFAMWWLLLMTTSNPDGDFTYIMRLLSEVGAPHGFTSAARTIGAAPSQ
jgi:hypothetical protein